MDQILIQYRYLVFQSTDYEDNLVLLYRYP
jgi:hypothetical protein